MGLGPLHSVSLADARIAAREARRCLLDKVDPLEKKHREADQQRRDEAHELPFDACAKQYIEAHGDGWRSANELLGAMWSEVDLVNGVWTVPAERMKAGRVHRVPLVDATVKLLRAQIGLDAVHVFPGAKKGTRLSAMSMSTVLQRLQRDDLTVHGFRSTFRDWAAEAKDYPGELAEIALAHTVGTAVENAYRRGDLFERRRRLMADWAAWCGVQKAPSNARPAVDALEVSKKSTLAGLRPVSQTPVATPIHVGNGVELDGPP
jgi:integrase